MNNHENLIAITKNFVQQHLENAEGGHDWFHIERVYKTAVYIASKEQADLLVVRLGALLHDIADAKFHNDDELLGGIVARQFLERQELPLAIINHVVAIIENVSFKGGNETESFSSTELKIIQDADRLDAIGAIGIARAFNYGGFKNRKLYDPEISPNLNMDKETYRKSTAPTLNHFYEKLLLLKDKMHTQTAKRIAAERHAFMEEYLKQFYKEWDAAY